MDCQNNMADYGEVCDILEIKEEDLNPDEITTESLTSPVQQNDEHFVNCVQSSVRATKAKIIQEPWAPNAVSADIKFNPKQPSTCLVTGTLKADDQIVLKEHIVQDEVSPESQRLHLQQYETHFMEFNVSSDIDSKTGIKQEPWDPNAVSGDIKCDPEQPFTLDLAPFLVTSPVKGDIEVDNKEELWRCEEMSSDSVNETEGSGSKASENAEEVALLELPRSYTEMVYSTTATQLQENKSTTCLSTKPSTSAQTCKAKHRCKACGKRFKLLSYLKNHNLHHQECQWRNYDMDCTFSADLKDQLIHNDMQQYTCDTCGKTFSKLGHLKVHLLVHGDKRPYQCQICEKSFKDPSNLRAHFLVHKDKKQYKCEICDKSFKHVSSFKRHLLLHDDKRLYKCQICGKSFKELRGLKLHLMVHDDKRQYKCQICEKSFKLFSYLKTHLLVHDSNRQFKCEICAKSFKQLAHLKTHLLIHDYKRQFKCEICAASFKRLVHFKTHLLVHDDNRQFKCEHCESSFKRLAHLKSHLLVHDNKRQHKCEICEKSFKLLSTLKSHLLVHDDKSQFKCKVCAKSFKHLSSFKRHLLIHSEKSNTNCNFVHKY